MKKVDHQNAMKRAEYEDQLRQQAKDRNMQRELEMQRKQEELKRRKFFYQIQFIGENGFLCILDNDWMILAK